MNNFSFLNPTRIIFGKGAESGVGKEIAQYGKKVLLHYGGGSIKRSGLYDRVVKSLKDEGITIVELGGVVPNPRLSLVYEGIKLCRENNIDVILAVGGGSVIDSAKAIAVGVKYDGDVWDFYDGKGSPKAGLPIATILTIPAAGSESSDSCVITKEEGDLKRGHNSDCFYPKFSILNPEFCFSLPKNQVANGAADIMAHLCERYFTNTPNVELTDNLIEAVMRTVIHNVPRVLAKNDDYDAWAEVMWSGTIAHNNLLQTGRVGDWASHMIEHELSAIYDIAHGAGLAVVFPAWMKYTLHNDVNRFCRFAVKVFGADYNFTDPMETALEGIARFEGFLKSIGLATRLSGMGIGDKDFETMAQKCTRNDTKTVGNFVRLSSKDIVEIYKLGE